MQRKYNMAVNRVALLFCVCLQANVLAQSNVPTDASALGNWPISPSVDPNWQPVQATYPEFTTGLDPNGESRNIAQASAEAVDPVAAELAKLQKRLAELEGKQKKAEDKAKEKADADAKKPTVQWTGQLQDDYYWFGQDEANRLAFGDIQDGNAFRRARIGMFGTYGPTEYRIETDFALVGRPSFLDVFAGIKDVPGLGRVRVGHFFEPFSLERLTPNRYVTFMERSLPDQPFAPARNTGIMFNNVSENERATWALGMFRTDSDVFGDDQGDGFEESITGRVTALPHYDEACDGSRYLHLGLGYSFRSANGDVMRFRSQPESRLGAMVVNVPFMADTDFIRGSNFQLVGSEFAWIHGPLSLQSEYMLVPVDPATGSQLYFQAWYATASYFLTGEHRPYRKDNGTFDRVIPKYDAVSYSKDKAFCRGPGAWEIAMRLSQLDLNDQAIRGGRLTDLTVGLNWYLNPYLRFTSNYIHAMVDESVNADSALDIYAMRVGFDF